MTTIINVLNLSIFISPGIQEKGVSELRATYELRLGTWELM